jgi:multiple sugar transport system permease protein
LFTIPYAAMILIGFFEDIPVALEEAAWIDGCSRVEASSGSPAPDPAALRPA